MLNLITKIKAINPVCKLLKEHNDLCVSTQTAVMNGSKSVLQNLTPKEKKPC